MEVIVVDDESSDNTLPIIVEALSNSPLDFKVFFTGGKGLGYARQLVVKNAKGKYILWVDGDMILPKNYIAQQVDFMERNPKVGKARAKWGILKEESLPARLESYRLITRLSDNKNNSFMAGIGGSICCTSALKQVGGFDEKIRGAGEDIDIVLRLVKSWRVATSNAIFYHRFRKTWSELWQQYYWYGYGLHYVNNKHKHVVKLWLYLPPIAFLVGIRQTINVLKLVKDKAAFFIPFHQVFKYCAWLNGYVKSHFDGYGHFKRNSIC
jgi:glycosyltransferase involved in cell wall biosynthesis